MAFDEALAGRVREYMGTRPGYSEKKMFGGLCFLINGNMCCGINEQDLMLRVGPDLYDQTMARPGARPMDFTGRALRGMVYVGPDHLRTAKALTGWVDTALGFVESLPAKKPRRPKARARRSRAKGIGS